MVNKEHSVEVIDLMLQADRQNIFGFHIYGSLIPVKTGHFDLRLPDHFRETLHHTEAGLFPADRGSA